VALPGARFRVSIAPSHGEGRVSEPKRHPAIIGTDKLGRAFTDDERAVFSALLREHDFVGACMIALRFAFKLRRAVAAAQDLLGRAKLRLVRQGWDPNEVTLVKRLCRLVWSEHTNELSESATARKAEEIFLREQQPTAPSPEDLALRFEREREEEARATKHIDALRASFEAAKDEVNLLWLKYKLDDVDEPKEMALRSGLDPMEFYRAAERRNRHVMRLLAAQGGAKKDEEKT
jgi:hypothetical protein